MKETGLEKTDYLCTVVSWMEETGLEKSDYLCTAVLWVGDIEDPGLERTKYSNSFVLLYTEGGYRGNLDKRRSRLVLPYCILEQEILREIAHRKTTIRLVALVFRDFVLLYFAFLYSKFIFLSFENLYRRTSVISLT